MAPVPSRDEINKQLKEASPRLEAFFSNLTGKRVKITPDEEMVSVVSNIVPFADDLGKLFSSAQSMSEAEKKEMLGKLLNGLMSASMGSNAESPLDSFIKLQSSAFEDHDKDGRLKGTNFAAYKNAVFEMVDQIYSKGKREEIKALFNDTPDEDVFAIGQSLGRLEKKVPYLAKTHKNVTKQVIEKYISIYDELAGYMEKLSMQLFGIKEVLEGKNIAYADLKKRKFAHCVDSLLAVPEFAPLMKPVDSRIRNAIAHKRVIFEPLTRTVKFVDNHKFVALKYEDFILQTRELYSATYCASHVETAINLRLWQYVRDYINSDNNKQ